MGPRFVSRFCYGELKLYIQKSRPVSPQVPECYAGTEKRQQDQSAFEQKQRVVKDEIAVVGINVLTMVRAGVTRKIDDVNWISNLVSIPNLGRQVKSMIPWRANAPF